MMARKNSFDRSREGYKLKPLSFALGGIAGAAVMFLIMINALHVHHTNVVTKPWIQSSHASAGPPPVSMREKGWKPIQVFYGEESGLGAPPDREWFAQVHQDQVLINLIGPRGYFIDLAANDAVEYSNTLALERHGWNGLCIEPNPRYWYGLSHRKCAVVGALIGATKEKVEVKFRGVYGGIVGKMDQKLANRKREPDSAVEQRYTSPFLTILEMFNVPKQIDYLSLDVEGAEYLVMKDFPFELYQIKIMTVERPSNELKKLLEDKGFLFLKDLAWWGETLWAHQSTGFTTDHLKVKLIKTEERN